MLPYHRVSCDFNFMEIRADYGCKTETCSEMKFVVGFIFVWVYFSAAMFLARKFSNKKVSHSLIWITYNKSWQKKRCKEIQFWPCLSWAYCCCIHESWPFLASIYSLLRIHAFYKNVVYKNVEAEICRKCKNVLRIFQGSQNLFAYLHK